MVRTFAPEGSKGRKYASVVALIGAVDSPLIYMASIWWRTAHPDLNIGPLAESDLDSRMLMVFLVSLVTFTVFYLYLILERIEIRRAEDSLDEAYQNAQSNN